MECVQWGGGGGGVGRYSHVPTTNKSAVKKLILKKKIKNKVTKVVAGLENHSVH